MNKKALKKLIPPIVFEEATKLRVLRHRKECQKLPETGTGKQAVIIGNGPSLNTTIEKHIDFLRANDCFMVNQSVKSSFFELIQPCYYVMADPFYFQKDNMPGLAQEIDQNMSQKLKWDMTLLVPKFGEGSLFINEQKKNPKLNILYYSSTFALDCDGISKKKIFEYWDNNIASPLSQTVLNTATSLAISMRYSKIYLVGADTSWIESLMVDQETNDLYTMDKHFYGDRKILISNYSSEKSNIAEELDGIKRSFASYQILKEYAQSSGCQLYNASEYSLIDCLERCKL